MKKNHRYLFPIHSVLVIPFLLQICLAVGITGWLSARHGQKAVHTLANQLAERTEQQVGQHLENFLEIPTQVTQENLRLFQDPSLLKNREFAHRIFHAQVQTHPQLGYVTYAQPNGDFLGIGRWLAGHDLVSDEISAQAPDLVRTHSLDTQGQPQNVLFEATTPAPTQQDWYRRAVQAQQPIWSTTVEEGKVDGSQAFVAITRSVPVYDPKDADRPTFQRNLLGVLGADLLLTDVSQYLAEIEFSPGGEIFIVQRDGQLIGNSTQEPITTISEAGKVSRLSLHNTSNPLLKEMAATLPSNTFSALQSAQQLSLKVSGEHYFVRLQPWRDESGLDWIVIVALPELDFMAEIRASAYETLGLCIVALLTSTLLGLYTARRIATPIQQLQAATQAMSRGDLDTFAENVPDTSISEISNLSAAFRDMTEQLTDLFQRLNHRAKYDSLTGLYNRTSFREHLQDYLRDCQQEERSSVCPTNSAGLAGSAGSTALSCNSQRQTSPECSQQALLFLDLDYFKLVNDSLGHLVGDQLLVKVSKRLQQAIRTDDILARFGGDEFVLLLRSIRNRNEAVAVSERLIQTLQQPFLVEGNEIFIDVSIGVVMIENALLQQNWETADDLLRSADVALYRAKGNGRGRYELFDSQMHADVVNRLSLETDLRHAIAREEMTVYYQPIVDAVSQKIQGFEALLRWQHPQQGWISPATFIPVAEETGLIVKIGWWVLEQSCQQMSQWRSQFPEYGQVTVSVNMSSKQFLQPNLVEEIQQVLQRTHLPAACLKIEITESLLMHHKDAVATKLKELQDLGVALSLDDFGTGYCSLSYLHQFPVNTLKIDQSFIRKMSQGHQHQAIVKTIIELAKHMDLDVVAEGVEEEQELSELQHLGCEMIQGYLISRPLASAKATEFLGDTSSQALAHA